MFLLFIYIRHADEILYPNGKSRIKIPDNINMHLYM